MFLINLFNRKNFGETPDKDLFVYIFLLYTLECIIIICHKNNYY